MRMLSRERIVRRAQAIFGPQTDRKVRIEPAARVIRFPNQGEVWVQAWVRLDREQLK